MVGFISTSMGDFQYTTNDKYDIIASRAGKIFLQAPRWYMANIATAWPVSLLIDSAYKKIPAFQKMVGTGNRTIGMYDYGKKENPELFKYQLQTWLGTMMFWLLSSIGVMMYGRIAKRGDFDWNIDKGIGNFRVGNWEVSESTGTWDAFNTLRGTLQDLGRGGIGTKPRIGETTDEAENAGFIRALQRLGYKKSPFITFYWDKLFRGRDALNRAVYNRNEEYLLVYEDLFKDVLAPSFKAAGINMPDQPLVSSMIATQQVPTAFQDAWSAYTAAKREELGDKHAAWKTSIGQYFWAWSGARVKYSPYVSPELKQLYNRQWVVKKFVESYGPTAPELVGRGGLAQWWETFRTGNQ